MAAATAAAVLAGTAVLRRTQQLHVSLHLCKLLCCQAIVLLFVPRWQLAAVYVTKNLRNLQCKSPQGASAVLLSPEH